MWVEFSGVGGGARRCRLLLVVTLVFGAAACQQGASPPGESAESAEVAAPVVQQSVPVARSTPQAAAPAENLEPLDLSLPRDLLEGDSGQVVIDQPDLLPDLFNDPGKERATRLSGKVMLDEDTPQSLESMRGVEVTIERKID